MKSGGVGGVGGGRFIQGLPALSSLRLDGLCKLSILVCRRSQGLEQDGTRRPTSPLLILYIRALDIRVGLCWAL